jgi:hypothetical protein
MSDQALRSKLIRLAHNNPELRPHLMPLLGKTAGPFESVDSSKSDYGVAKEAMNDAIAYLRKAEENASRAFNYALEGAEQNAEKNFGRHLDNAEKNLERYLDLLITNIAEIDRDMTDCEGSLFRPMQEAIEALAKLSR